jgi:hypothetical protein
MRKLNLNTCSPTIFIMPVSEDEGEKLIKDPKLMAGIDKIPD